MAANKTSKQDKGTSKLAKALAAKGYYGVTACGKTFKMKAPAVWNKGWRAIADAPRDDDGSFRIAFVCKKCGRMSPTKTYLCKPKDLEI